MFRLNNIGLERVGFSVLIFILALTNLFAQDGTFKADRKEAEKALKEENYSIAIQHYTALSEKYKADPLYKYYSAVCYVNLEQEISLSIELLEEAIRNSSALRLVPDKAWYYLGRANHLSADFDAAINSYDKFRELAKRKEIKALLIDELIAECNMGSEVPEIIDSVENEIDRDTAVNKDVVILQQQEALPVVGDIELIETDSLYDSIAREALEFQFLADSISRLADRYRKSLPDLSGSDRETIRMKIISLEELLIENQAMADRKYREAAILAARLYDDEPDQRLFVPEEQAQQDLQISEAEETPVDTIIIEKKNSILIDSGRVETYAFLPVLELFSDQTKQANDIPVNPVVPEGLYYRIQTAAFRNPVDPDFFKTLGPVSGFKSDNSEITYFSIGQFRTKEAADRAQVKIRRNGFNDAFVLAIMDGKRISLERATVFEKDWSGVSLISRDNEIGSTAETQVEPEEPPTLVYRVEVMKIEKKVSDDDFDTIKKLAGERNLDVFETADEEYVYLIGKFLTFDSAVSYADLLYRNGLKDAKVVAYLGKKEILLETARKLFEMYFEK